MLSIHQRSGGLCMLPVALFVCAAGCSVGYNRVLFITKTNVGLEASSKPPAFGIDIDRVEGVIAPQFEKGKKLPVLASFKLGSDGIFAPSLGSAFATGDAASTLAALYDSATPAATWETRVKLVRDSKPVYPASSTLELDKKPTTPTYAWDIEDALVAPVFFGTDTSLGLKVSWSDMSGGFPDSFKLGYNRKELAVAPVTMREVKDSNNPATKYEVNIASLLATLDFKFDPSAGPGQAKTTYVQYFATGEAATLLSLQRDVRQAMLYRLDPNQKASAALFAESQPEEVKEIAYAVMRQLFSALQERSKDGDAEATTLVRRLNAVTPSDLRIDFTAYELGEPAEERKRSLTAKEPVELSDSEPFQRLLDYESKLTESLKSLTEGLRLTNDELVLPENVAREKYETDRQEMEKKQARVRALLSDPALADAVRYFIK